MKWENKGYESWDLLTVPKSKDYTITISSQGDGDYIITAFVNGKAIQWADLDVDLLRDAQATMKYAAMEHLQTYIDANEQADIIKALLNL